MMFNLHEQKLNDFPKSTVIVVEVNDKTTLDPGQVR